MAKILLVDDNELVRATTRAILERAGHEVHDAIDGEAVLHHVTVVKPDLVLTDILMPNKEGIELIIELRRAGYTGPIIAMSGGGRIGSTDLLGMARKLGATDSVSKPFGRADLLAKVDACLKADHA